MNPMKTIPGRCSNLVPPPPPPPLLLLLLLFLSLCCTLSRHAALSASTSMSREYTFNEISLKDRKLSIGSNGIHKVMKRVSAIQCMVACFSRGSCSFFTLSSHGRCERFFDWEYVALEPAEGYSSFIRVEDPTWYKAFRYVSDTPLNPADIFLGRYQTYSKHSRGNTNFYRSSLLSLWDSLPITKVKIVLRKSKQIVLALQFSVANRSISDWFAGSNLVFSSLRNVQLNDAVFSMDGYYGEIANSSDVGSNHSNTGSNHSNTGSNHSNTGRTVDKGKHSVSNVDNTTHNCNQGNNNGSHGNQCNQDNSSGSNATGDCALGNNGSHGNWSQGNNGSHGNWSQGNNGNYSNKCQHNDGKKDRKTKSVKEWLIPETYPRCAFCVSVASNSSSSSSNSSRRRLMVAKLSSVANDSQIIHDKNFVQADSDHYLIWYWHKEKRGELISADAMVIYIQLN